MIPKERLRTPGPVEVPPAVLEAVARAPLHHRSDAFARLFDEARRGLAELLTVPGDEVMVLTGSGTAGFEAGFRATVPAGGKVIALHAGRFARRWLELARAYGHEVVPVEAPWGETFDEAAVREAFAAHPDAAAVTMVHSETSTGVLHDVEGLAALARRLLPDALLLVDAVTSLGVAPLRPRTWELDVVVSGSQKGVMLPPGLAFAWLSERAWAAGEAKRGPSFYLDLHREREAQRRGQPASTPATSLVAGLPVALGMLLDGGLEVLWADRARLNRALLEAGRAAGCTPFAAVPSPAVAALALPEGLEAPRVRALLAERGMHVGGGQEHIKPRVLRPSLLGWTDESDALALAAALESALRAAGAPVARGAAVGAAMAVLEG